MTLAPAVPTRKDAPRNPTVHNVIVFSPFLFMVFFWLHLNQTVLNYDEEESSDGEHH